jgi:prepilin-type N-terminal cleavage/methylation domain-containing protein
MKRAQARGYTLLELLIVIGILAVLAGMATRTVLSDWFQAQLPESAQRMRSLLHLVRANAMLEGRRYRVRFPRPDEIDGAGDSRQPLVEVERDPLREPEIFTPVLASWAQEATLERSVRCVQVRLGKPTVEQLLGEAAVDEAEELAEEVDEAFEEESFEDDFPPLVFEPDGTSEWATFVLTDAPEELALEDLDPNDRAYGMIEVILDGLTGLAWLQRPLYEEELEMMEEHGWPPVLRKDFLERQALTEDNVLEIRERLIRQ